MDGTVSQFEKADSLLNRLAASSSLADPMCSRSEWCFAFHDIFQSQRKLHLRTTQDSVLTLAEIVHPTVGPLLEPLEAHWFFSRPLLGPDALGLLKELLADLDRQHTRPCMAISGLDVGSPLLSKLLKAFSDRYQVGSLEPILFRSASLQNGPDGFLSRRTRKFRSNLKRAILKGAEVNIQFERCIPTTEEEADLLFNRMVQIESTSWKGIEQCGMTEEPYCTFYREVYKRMCRNKSGLSIFAKHDNQDIGFVMGGIDGTAYRGQQFTYRKEWAPFSVGNLLQWEMIQWLCELGMHRYDMGSVLEYKMHWAEIETTSHTLVWRPS